MGLPDAWWVLDPIGHRQLDVAEGHAWAAEGPENGVHRMTLGGLLADDEWVCDWCNGSIEIYGPNKELLFVPMLNSNALCKECVKRHIMLRPDSAALMHQWITGGGIGFWSGKACACPPCMARGEAILAEVEENRNRGDSGASDAT